MLLLRANLGGVYRDGAVFPNLREAVVPITEGQTKQLLRQSVDQLVTLPVEFNASQRAMAYMGQIGLPAQERKGAFDVLRACAFTYLAAALTSILQLLWLLGQRQE